LPSVIVAVALGMSFSSSRRIVVPVSAVSSIPSQFFFFDCLTSKIKAVRSFETWRTKRPTHLEHSVTCQEKYIFRIMFLEFKLIVQLCTTNLLLYYASGSCRAPCFVWRCLEIMDSKCKNFYLETRWMWKPASSLDRLYSRRVNPTWMYLTVIRKDVLKRITNF
jgi:hypothetical protein